MKDRLVRLLQNNSYLDVLDDESWLLAAEQLIANGVLLSDSDVVEVIRCKDCVNRNTPDCAMWYQCDVCGGQWSWNNECGFCSYGTRAETEKPQKRFFSPEDVRKMSSHEVREHYQAIIDSMEEW